MKIPNIKVTIANHDGGSSLGYDVEVNPNQYFDDPSRFENKDAWFIARFIKSQRTVFADEAEIEQAEFCTKI